MRKRPLGSTGLLTTELALGTWGLSGDAYGPVPARDVDKTIARAVQLGINLFDTSDAYAEGEMQRALGRLLPEKSTHVICRVGIVREGYPEKRFDRTHLQMAFEKAQDRLRRAAIDVLMLQTPSAKTFDDDEPFAYLESLRSSAQIRAWGVSAGSLAIGRRALARGANVVSMPYNCFFFRDLEDLVLEQNGAGAGLVAHSVLAYGLLAGTWTEARDFYEGDHRAERWNTAEWKARIGQLAALREVVGGPMPTLRSVALRFVLQNTSVSSAILGPRNVAQLDQLVRDAGRMAPYMAPPTYQRFRQALRAHGVTGT